MTSQISKNEYQEQPCSAGHVERQKHGRNITDETAAAIAELALAVVRYNRKHGIPMTGDNNQGNNTENHNKDQDNHK